MKNSLQRFGLVVGLKGGFVARYQELKELPAAASRCVPAESIPAH